MIVGEVNSFREPIIHLTVQGGGGASLAVDAIVDTGFTAMLTLPSKLVRRLKLPFRGTVNFELADGSQSEFDLFVGQVEWNGRWREVVVAAADGGALIGMELMQGYDLAIQVVDGGRVEIRSRDE